MQVQLWVAKSGWGRKRLNLRRGRLTFERFVQNWVLSTNGYQQNKGTSGLTSSTGLHYVPMLRYGYAMCFSSSFTYRVMPCISNVPLFAWRSRNSNYWNLGSHPLVWDVSCVMFWTQSACMVPKQNTRNISHKWMGIQVEKLSVIDLYLGWNIIMEKKPS